MLHNTLQVNATQMAPDQRGSSLALFACALFMGHAVGVSVAGVLAERVGTGPVIAGSGALLLVVGLAFAAALRRSADHVASRAQFSRSPSQCAGFVRYPSTRKAFARSSTSRSAMLVRSCWRRCSTHDSSMNTST